MLLDVAPGKNDLEKHKVAPKPHLHITSPLGWLNDPCAPCYDSNTGLYHLFYQCNPNGVQWGDMSWGHATSEDLVAWKFGSQHTKLEPDEDYDNDGVFTGCMAPIAADGTMPIFYSSICKLPFHWTNPAPRGSAGLSMATSKDEGRTWVKSDLNPILKEEPEGLKVTGFRDPYLAEWDNMDRLRETKKPMLYGLISGGIVNQGPTTFVYAVDPADLTWWEYMGPLIDVPERFQHSSKWDSNYGLNWECVNFMTLDNGSVSQDFLTICSEGDVPRDHLVQKGNGPEITPNIPSRAIRSQQWLAGDLVKTISGIRLAYRYGGLLDHGIYYAANSFHDVKTNRRIVYGWIPEDDCPIEYVQTKNWNGSQALPRELSLVKISNITKAVQSPLDTITNMEFAEQSKGTYTAYTMGIKPLEELKNLRKSAQRVTELQPFILGDTNSSSNESGPDSQTKPQQRQKHITTTNHSTWELEAQITIPNQIKTLRNLGFHIKSSKTQETKTTISFDPRSESLQVDRSHSIPHDLSQSMKFNTCPEQGSFTLFSQLDTDDVEKTETLNLRICSDGDILEIFANDRFALATMVYTGDVDLYGGISAFVTFHSSSSSSSSSSLSGASASAGTNPNPEGNLNDDMDGKEEEEEEEEEEVVGFESVKVWDGLGAGMRYVGYDADTVPVEIMRRRQESLDAVGGSSSISKI